MAASSRSSVTTEVTGFEPSGQGGTCTTTGLLLPTGQRASKDCLPSHVEPIPISSPAAEVASCNDWIGTSHDAGVGSGRGSSGGRAAVPSGTIRTMAFVSSPSVCSIRAIRRAIPPLRRESRKRDSDEACSRRPVEVMGERSWTRQPAPGSGIPRERRSQQCMPTSWPSTSTQGLPRSAQEHSIPRPRKSKNSARLPIERRARPGRPR